MYIPGKQNCVTDTLSRLLNSVDTQTEAPIAFLLSISLDNSLLKSIIDGYKTDPFYSKIARADKLIDGIQQQNGLLYIGDCLVIPQTGSLWEDLFHLAHDNLGHFSFEKSYDVLRHDYYWSNMHKNLSKAYIPACIDCQHNKGQTTKPVSPLHPLLVPDQRGDSIAIDFIGPCPRDDGFDCIVTITDRLGADIQITPTHMDISAECFTAQFFNLWYCENGLPLDIVSDCDQLFISKF